MKYQSNMVVFTAVFTSSVVYFSAMFLETMWLPLLFLLVLGPCLYLMETFSEDEK